MLSSDCHIGDTLDIIEALVDERDDALDAGDLQFAHECLTSAVECATMITDRLGPEWFTDVEVDMIENLFMEYADNG
jgi:hypothetical protein